MTWWLHGAGKRYLRVQCGVQKACLGREMPEADAPTFFACGLQSNRDSLGGINRGYLAATRSRREVHTSLQGLQVLFALSAVRHTEELPHTLDCRQHTLWLNLQSPSCSHLQTAASARIFSTVKMPFVFSQDILVHGKQST